MSSANTSTITLLSILVAIVVFLFFNNVIHAGFHVGHSHDTSLMMSDVHDRVTEDTTNAHGHNDAGASYEVYPGYVADKLKNNEDIIVLDVRTPEEYAEVHLQNALLLSVGKLSADSLAAIGLGEDAKDKEIIVYCRSGARSRQAYEMMKSLGYTNVKSIAGGMVHWQEDNYQFTETGDYEGPTVESPVSQATGPQISFDRKLHDFGDVPQSQGVIETSFELSNTGTTVLSIGELSTSCGCTTAEISETSIKPGKTATLRVFFDPDFHKEPADKLTRTVFIPSNDPNTPEAEVKITVDILEGE